MKDDFAPHHPKEEITVSPTGGLRFNKNKLPLSWVPTSLVRAVAGVLKKGAEKYAKDNWRKGMSWTEVSESLERHLLAWRDGEDLDPETELPHLDHMACNIAFLIEFQKRNLGQDDRYDYDTLSRALGPICAAAFARQPEQMN
jgi:hypothetical protein